MFYHLRSINLYNAKHLQFHQKKKQERNGAVQKTLHLTMFYFLNLMELLVPFEFHKKNHCDGSIIIFDGFWIKL